MDYVKVPQKINNVVGDNLKLLAKLFPSVIKDGLVDFEALKEELGQFEEVGNEKYGLTWAGKQDAKKKAQEDVYNRTLNYIESDSKNPETTENLYIEGDNLEILKLLHQNYYNAIKMIYIDPPYNTGNDFVYNDNFAMSSRESDIAEGTRDDEGNSLQRNQQSTNRFHANWLNMIYPRLRVAKDLLKDDGAIFISIDDNEVDNLKKICNEVFGEENFIACVVWERAFSPVNLKKHFSESHDYIVCYAKNIDDLTCNGLPRSEEANDRYSNPDNDPRGNWASADLSVGPAIQSNIYEITTPSGRKVLPPSGYSWRLNKERYFEFLRDGRIWFGDEGNGVPRIKRFLNEVKQGITPMTIWKHQDVGHSQKASQDLKKLFDNNAYFTYPKPIELIKRLLELYSNKDSLILDFFSGSATSAHAVMQLNAEDGGNRKFIMAQTYEEKCAENSEAFKAGYKNICEIGKERIRRAGEKIKQEIDSSNAQLKIGEEPRQVPDIGFKVFRTADTNIKWNMYDMLGQLDTSAMTHTPDLADFTMGFTDIDVVYEVMLRQKDVPLSSTLETLTDIGSRTYLYGSAYLVCLETEITENLIDKLAALDPLPIKFIFRDSAFKDDINLKDETFRRLKNLIERNSGLTKKTYTVEFI